jgi:predicted phosphodiesterase
MIKASLYNFFGKIYIPDSFDYDAPYLLHISDTPSSIFKALESLIKQVQPQIIIHTGDLVDNLKIGLYPSSLDGYKRYVKRLTRILEGGERQVYYAIGNHDDLDSLKKSTLKGHIIPVYDRFNTKSFSFGMAHDIEDIPKEGDLPDMLFFGHNLEMNSNYEGHPQYFNGIEKIALINLNTKEIFTFDYPIGTKESRLIIYRKGL